MNNLSNYKKALVIGTGSGGDILTSLLVVGRLKNSDIKIDLAGFLTPWSLHYFNGKLEKPINKLNDKKSSKIIPTKENEKLPFFEPNLYKINKNGSLGFQEMYLFSLQYGTKKLKQNIQKLVDKNKYDLIIAVDVGGDVLARKADLNKVFTPIVDFSCINILNSIKTSAKKYLVVVSPGIDGELDGTSLKRIIKEYQNKKQIIDIDTLKDRGTSNTLFLNAVKEIGKHMVFSSHTTEIIKNILKGAIIKKEEYIKSLKVGNKKWSIKYSVELDHDLINKIFYFELNEVYRTMPIKADYATIFQAYKLFKENGVGGTEVDLTYIPSEIKNGKYLKCIFISNIFYRVSDKQKNDIMKYIKIYSQ